MRRRSPDIYFLPLDCVVEVFSWLARAILLIGADERVDDREVESGSTLFFHAGGLLKSAPRLCCQVHLQRVGSAVLFTSTSLEGLCVFNDK